MTIQPDYVKEELLHELSESFRMHNQLPPDLFTRYRIKRGLRNADGTGVLVGASHLGNVHGYILNEGEREPIEGRLTYRGYNVYDLIHGLEQENRFGFEEIGYLLMCGKLPSRRQLAEFQHTIGLERALPDNFTEDMIMRAPSRDIMNKLASATLALYSYDANPDETTVENIMRQGISLMAKFPVIISHAYQAKRRYFDNDSMFLHVPDPNRSTAENILHLIRPTGEFNDDEAKLLDRCLILHAEHGGGNNSSFTVRVTSSSGTDTYSAIAAAVSSLKGPRHGGANLRVVKQFEEMKENIHNWKDETEVGNYLRKILNKGSRRRLRPDLRHGSCNLHLERPACRCTEKGCSSAGGKDRLFGRNGPDRAGRKADAGRLCRNQGQRQADVRKRRYVLRLCLQNARTAQVAVYAAVRYRAYRRLDGTPP